MKTYKVEVNDDGTKSWYLNGKLHRKDGPAVERADGSKEWWTDPATGEKSKSYYTCRESRTPVIFPYVVPEIPIYEYRKSKSE